MNERGGGLAARSRCHPGRRRRGEALLGIEAVGARGGADAIWKAQVATALAGSSEVEAGLATRLRSPNNAR